MLGPLIFVAAVNTTSPMPSPYPTASPLRIIVTVKASSFCSAVRSMAAPIGFVVHKNDEAFSSLIANPPSLDPRDPNRFAAAIATAKIMYAVVHNLVLAEDILRRSWTQYPQGKDSNIDALRQRLQNLIDLQRGITNDYYVLGHGDDSELANSGADTSGDTGRPLRLHVRPVVTGSGIIGGMREADAEAAIDISHERDPEQFPVADARAMALHGHAREQEREFDLQQYAFSSEFTTALKTCGLQ